MDAPPSASFRDTYTRKRRGTERRRRPVSKRRCVMAPNCAWHARVIPLDSRRGARGASTHEGGRFQAQNERPLENPPGCRVHALQPERLGLNGDSARNSTCARHVLEKEPTITTHSDIPVTQQPPSQKKRLGLLHDKNEERLSQCLSHELQIRIPLSGLRHPAHLCPWRKLRSVFRIAG